MNPKVYFLEWNKRGDFPIFLKNSGISSIINRNDIVAIKTHFGEQDNIGYVKPEFLKMIARAIKKNKAKPFITDTNTIYHGQRANSVDHLAIAFEHGFSLDKTLAPIIIADGVKGLDYKDIPINGNHFTSVKIAKSIIDSDAIIITSHFKGHMLAGIGGAIKNLGMGCSARLGKFEMHSSVSPRFILKKCIGCGKCIKVCSHGALSINNIETVDKLKQLDCPIKLGHDKKHKIKIDQDKCAGCGECIVACDKKAIDITWNETSSNVQEKFVEYALGAVKNKKIFCISFINHITANCDCMATDEKPIHPDIGIMISTDPVAIDQACIDIVNKRANKDLFKETHPNINYNVQLEYAQKLSLGSRKYELIS